MTGYITVKMKLKGKGIVRKNIYLECGKLNLDCA
jgi:hypothetical protein